MRIGCDVTGTGLELRLDERRFPVRFPREVWQDFPHRDAFADHYAFIKTLHLPWMLARDMPLHYETAQPLYRHAMFMAVLNNVSFCADVDGISTAEQLRRFMALDITFADHRTKSPTGGRVLGERCVVNMSLGKDSLLTWAVARELGLKPVLYVSVDNDCPREYAYKADIAARFCAEFGETVHVVENDTGVIHRYEYWQTPPTEWGFGHLITEYAMLAMPFAHRHDARYVLLGNEKSCDDTYVTHDGFKAWPVYDQSSEWGLELANLARKPVITATQMLESMVLNPRPTRAEASDVANAIYDGTSAVMLSGETASGKHPLRSVRIMEKIIRTAERDVYSRMGDRRRRGAEDSANVTAATVRAAAYAAYEAKARLIAVYTETGSTATLLSGERPPTHVVAFTPSQRTMQKLALVWGIVARKIRPGRTSHELTLDGDRIMRSQGLVKAGERIVQIAGTVRQSGLTNTMSIREM